MAHRLGAGSPEMVQRHLQDFSFPAYKKELSQHLRQRGVDGAVCDAMEELPDREYRDVVEVMDAIAARRDARGRGDAGDHARQSSGMKPPLSQPKRQGGPWPQIQQALEAVRFPAHKRELVGRARQSNAGELVLAALEALPERDYDSIDDMMQDLADLRQ